MHQIRDGSGRLGALAPAVLLLAFCLLAVSAQAADAPRYVTGDILEIDFVNQTEQIVIAHVDTTSLPEPYYTAYLVDREAGRWVIPGYWHDDLKYTEEQLIENEHARRVDHVDPILVVITDQTITGGDMLYYGLSLAEARAGVSYPLEPEPGYPRSFPASYVVGDILGNVSDPDHGAVVSRSFEQDGATWYNVYLDTDRSGDCWMIEKFYNGDMRFSTSDLDSMGMRRVAHADPHTVIVNDTTTSTGEMGWYRLSLAEVLEGKVYDHMGAWHFVTGDILGNQTSPARYVVGSATMSDTGPSHYTLYDVVRSGDGWEIPSWVNAGVPLEVALGAQRGDLAYDLVDHADPHFAIVTDPAVAGGLTFAGLSLGEILGGTLGYPAEMPPVGGDRGYFLVSTVPAGADIYLEDIAGARTLKGNTTNGPLNITVMLTATPVRAIIANLTGYRDAVYVVTQYPPKDGTLPVNLTLEPAGSGPTPYVPHAVPCRVEAEDYDLGGEGVAYHDTTPGNSGGAYRQDDVDIERVPALATPNVGWIRDGEWLAYTVTVAESGSYVVSAQVASPNRNRTFTLSVDGQQPLIYSVPNTGSFETFGKAIPPIICWDPPNGFGSCDPVPVSLTAGTHTLRLAFHGDGQNIDWLELAPYSRPTPTPTPTPTPNGTTPVKPLAIPGTIQAEDYDNGGEGVAYHDTTPGNSGGAYRQDDVDIEKVPALATPNVGWIRNGEWLAYTANVTTAGTYTLTATVASPNTGRSIAAALDGVDAATIAVPNTGSFETFRTVQVPVTLPAGSHTLRLTFTGDGQNLDAITFTQGMVTTPTPTPTPEPSGGASFVAVPTTAPYGSAVKFTVTPSPGKAISAAWWSFDAPAHLNTWNSRAVNPTFFYPQRGTFSPLVRLTYTDGSTEEVHRVGYVQAT